MIELKKGYIGLCYPRDKIGRLIVSAERATEQDNEAEFSHALVFTSPAGDTFEALPNGIHPWHIRHYFGTKMMIVKPVAPEHALHCAVDLVMDKYNGKPYPWYRLLLALSPILRKINIIGIPYCSEVVGHMLQIAMVRNKPWKGLSPEMLGDEIRMLDGKNYHILFDDLVSRIP